MRYNTVCEKRNKGEGTMGKILCYIYENMADYEISLLMHYLRNIGKRDVVAVSESTRVITAQTGLHFVADISIKEWEKKEKAEDYDALIIPGGPINNDQNEICDIIKEMVLQDKLVAAICFGPQFLGRAGVLDTYKYTTSCSQDTILNLGCGDPFNRTNYVDSRCVIERNVITAKGHAFVDFAEAVCNYLDIFESAEQKRELFGRIVN